MGVRTVGKISKKGISGKVLTVVISLIIAFMALILLWGVLKEAMPLMAQAVENMITGFKNMICKMIPGLGILCKAGEFAENLFGG